jgi:branched-subunit amino acid aminotransferase/4-amino-4-deoxychorismate lyase
MFSIHRDRIGWTVATPTCAADRIEVFACGTAAIVSPIALLVDRDNREFVPDRVDIVVAQPREAFLAIQERLAPDI